MDLVLNSENVDLDIIKIIEKEEERKFLQNCAIQLWCNMLIKGQVHTPEQAKKCWREAKMLWDNKE